MKKPIIFGAIALFLVMLPITYYFILDEYSRDSVRFFFGNETYYIEHPSDTTTIADTVIIMPDTIVEEEVIEVVLEKRRVYRVIIASYRDKNLAYDRMYTLSDTLVGHRMQVLEQADNGFYRVSLDYFFKYKESISLIKEMKAENRDAWLLRDSI